MGTRRSRQARANGTGLRVLAGPDVPREEVAAARAAVLAYARRYMGAAPADRHDQTPFLAARYEFRYLGRDDYSREHETWLFDVVPIGGRTVRQPGGDGTDPGWFHLEQHYKRPPRALEAIAPDPSLAYRGMSWEEWQAIRRGCKVGSSGWYNIGQRGLTLFGEHPGTAVGYAAGFAPWSFTPGLRRPGVVIAVRRDATLAGGTRPDIPEGERAIAGKVDTRVIERIWYVHPTQIRWGEGTEVWLPRKGQHGSADVYHGTPSVREYAITQLSLRDLARELGPCERRIEARVNGRGRRPARR